ncbi:FAD assembly factor SdhE [Maricaulis maris]|uniref:FAD assembly factor SdhE n=1 Tax=Maricaulis maris TaxID=74318 RepID=A0A495DJU9_9PROT|nr:succinate dehydrogenase assembly factor 2 [Maricaulis maris]RKR02842.1 antitoxin CptB [Maricaulis maris]
MTDDIETQRKKLRIRAWRRGFKEADLILGRFADVHLDGLSPASLDAFEILLDENDADIYAWIIGKAATPDRFDTPVMDALKGFRVDADAAFGDGPKE